MSLPFKPSATSGFLPSGTAPVVLLDSPLALLLSNDAPFDDRISNELGSVAFGTEGGAGLAFGSADVLQFALTGEARTAGSLHLKRAKGEKLDGLDAYLPADLDYRQSLVVALVLSADAAVSAQTDSPFGAYLSLAGGTEASGGVRYLRCRAYPRNAPARSILADFFAGLRSPLGNAATVRDLEPHDVAAMEFRGRLALWGNLDLGYSVSGSKGVAVNDLGATFHYDVHAALRWGGRFELGGSFVIVSGPGHRPGWTRLRVHRASHRAAESHFGLDLKVGYEAQGLPSNAEGLLTALTGYDPKNVLDWIATAAGTETPGEALAQVRARFGPRAEKAVGGLLDSVFRSASFERAREKLGKTLAAYSKFADTADRRIIDLARRHLGSAATLARLESLLALTSREGLRGLSDGPTWALVDELYGDEIHALLSDQAAFAALRERAARLHAILEGKGEARPLHAFLRGLAERYNVDALVDTLVGGLDPDKLKAVATGRLGDLATTLFDYAEDQLSGPAAEAVVARVSSAASQLLALKQKLSHALETGLKNRLEVSLSQATRRTQSTGELVDVEFNVGTARGRELYDQARRGDFLAVLRGTDPSHALVHRGEFQRALASSRSLRIHAFGWANAFEVSVDQVARLETVTQDGGPVFLLGSETAQSLREVSGFDQQETVQSILELGVQGRAAAGAGTDEVLVGVLDSMRCTCAVLREVRSPRWEDLPKAFRLAHQLGIVPDPAQLVSSLRAEFGPQPPRAVSLRYNIGYDPAAFDALWARDFEAESEDRAFVSRTFRRLLMDRWAFEHPGFFRPDTAETYLRHHRIVRLKAGSVKNKRWRYVVTDDEGRKVNLHAANDVLYQAYMAETAFLKALETLDDACDQARMGRANWSALNNAILGFLAVPKDGLAFSKSVWKGNLFFLTLDAMLLEQAGDARSGRTLLQLDLTPHEGAAIRRFY